MGRLIATELQLGVHSECNASDASKSDEHRIYAIDAIDAYLHRDLKLDGVKEIGQLLQRNASVTNT